MLPAAMAAAVASGSAWRRSPGTRRWRRRARRGGRRRRGRQARCRSGARPARCSGRSRRSGVPAGRPRNRPRPGRRPEPGRPRVAEASRWRSKGPASCASPACRDGASVRMRDYSSDTKGGSGHPPQRLSTLTAGIPARGRRFQCVPRVHPTPQVARPLKKLQPWASHSWTDPPDPRACPPACAGTPWPGSAPSALTAGCARTINLLDPAAPRFAAAYAAPSPIPGARGRSGSSPSTSSSPAGSTGRRGPPERQPA